MEKFRLKEIFGGIQVVLNTKCFDISIVRHEHSYGGSEGLYELGVFWTDEPVYYKDEDGDKLEFINDVKGWLKPDEVTELVNHLYFLDQTSDRLVENILKILR